MKQLADRYHEVMTYRREGLSKFHANVLSLFSGPPARLCLPLVRTSDKGDTIKRIGPFHFADCQPIDPFVSKLIEKSRHPVTILEIGPGTGALARALRARYGARIARYYGLDRDRSVRGDFETLESIQDAPSGIDIVVAAEVIEHMNVDAFYSEILEPLGHKLEKTGAFVISTPNPLSPGGIARDFTHVQRYPWYDLYAIFRLAFDDVSVARVHYLFSIRRLLQLPTRFLLCLLLELEWCDTLVCIGSKPRVASSETP